jgi:hypothetical protein
MKGYLPANFFLSFSGLLISLLMSIGAPVYGQAQTDQATIGADQMLHNATDQQVQQLENQRNSFELSVQKEERSDDNYRNYAEQRVSALMKLKNAGGSPSRSLSQEKQGELYALQHWLQQDSENHTEEQARIQQLDQAIANLQQQQNQSLQDMRSDIHNMRVDADSQAANQKFQQQMSVNYFNELQSEMGAASWGRPPTDGTLNTQSGSLNRMFRGGGGGGFGGYGAGGYNY